VEINLHYLRKWTEDKRGTVDDRPFGGGPGMVLKLEPIYKALQELQGEDSFVILMGPQGKRLEQRLAIELASKSHLIIISGHYEGVDERVRENLIDMEVSIGDYILTCGELPAMVLIDCVVRLIPGVLYKSVPVSVPYPDLHQKDGHQLFPFYPPSIYGDSGG